MCENQTRETAADQNEILRRIDTVGKAARDSVALQARQTAEHYERLAKKYRMMEEQARFLKPGTAEEQTLFEIFQSVRENDRRRGDW